MRQTRVRYRFFCCECVRRADIFRCKERNITIPIRFFSSFRCSSAKNLDDTFTIVIHDGTDEATISYCPMTYCYNVLTAGADVVGEAMVNTAKALYLYNQAANEYFQ